MIIFILIGIALFGFLGYKVYNEFFNKNEERKQIDSIEFYGYTLSENDTDIYKTYFKELTKVLNEKPINYSDYAKTISKLFIIDLYTLDNKLGSTDIGGLEFIHKNLRENFINLPVLQQAKVILQMIKFLKCTAENANLKELGGRENCGKIRISKNITGIDFKIIDASPCGLKEKERKV